MAVHDGNRAHNQTVLSQLRPGDRTEFPRGGFSHWAIYIGDGKVIHVAGDVNDTSNGSIAANSTSYCSGVMASKAKVQIDNFWNVVDKSKARKNNDKDRERRPLPPEKIVRRAKEKLNERGYNIFTRNCEHFVNYCRYGDASSDQANTLTTGLVGGGTALALGVGAVAAVAYAVHSVRQQREQ